MNLISHLEGNLKAAVALKPATADEQNWLLELRLMYDGSSVGTTSFNLYSYSREEAEHIARNIKSNQFIMKEIDEFLWGESD